MPDQNAVVALTDRPWFEFLSQEATNGRLDEANFWRPLAKTGFGALSQGDPLVFRLKSPVNAIAGYGFYASTQRIPINIAWEAFGQANGAPTREAFVERIAGYRNVTPEDLQLSGEDVTCVMLLEAHFLQPEQWVPWGEDREWKSNIMASKSYDLTNGSGTALAELLANGRPSELETAYVPVVQDTRVRETASVPYREGQGAFRLRVLDAYGRRCAVTGERSLPVLDAAHIQRYLGPESNHVQNGLSLRTDIHRLYDAGYVTVSPDYKFEVSRRLRDEFKNGEVYYRLAGSKLASVPSRPADRPSQEALEWHATTIFH
jgi:putative restriction endonuclease